MFKVLQYYGLSGRDAGIADCNFQGNQLPRCNSLCRNFAASRYLRAWSYGGCACYGYMTRSVRRVSSGAFRDDTRHLRRQQGNEALVIYVNLAREARSKPNFLRRRKEKSRNLPSTQIAERRNDCLNAFGIRGSPRETRTQGSLVPASMPLSAPASCGQNTPLVAHTTHVWLLRRTPPSSSAFEPIATVRRSCKFGALANRSSACTSVPCSPSRTGMAELHAYKNWR